MSLLWASRSEGRFGTGVPELDCGVVRVLLEDPTACSDLLEPDCAIDVPLGFSRHLDCLLTVPGSEVLEGVGGA